MNVDSHKKATIKDIAREVGVSTTTVINVLKNRNSQVSPATITKVREKAAELGYVRNLAAAGLVSRRSHAIALVVTGAYNPLSEDQETDINPFYGELILRLENEARKAGYMLTLYGGGEDDYVNFVLERNLDVAILLGVRKPDLPRILARQGVPIILIDSSFRDPALSHVRTDEVLGGQLATNHLLSLGRRSLGFLGSTHMSPESVCSLRLQGARQACAAAGIELREFGRLALFEEGLKAANEVAASGVTGVVAAADNLAAGLVCGLTASGRKVPEEIAVIGYDNVLLARTVNPTLTTIDQGLGEKVRAIMDLVKSGQAGVTKLVQPRLVVRQSA